MTRILDIASKRFLGCGLALAMFVPLHGARSETVLCHFCSEKKCHDGYDPAFAAVISDGNGNLYGTAASGGKGAYPGGGTAYKLASDGTFSVLYSFCSQPNCGDGASPEAGLIEDAGGNLYGTTYSGGKGGCGTVFKLAPDGTETVLHSFTGGSDGCDPVGALITDRSGNFYGVANGYIDDPGTIFKVAPDGTETVLYAFTGGNDGYNPIGPMLADNMGNLYGTASNGGAGQSGTVFRLAANGTFSVLYTFSGGTDGRAPYGGLIADSSGNLYGTTFLGGANGHGTVFRLASDGTETVLHSFAGGSDGANPNPGLIMDNTGNLYDTTSSGGAANLGTLFMLTSAGTETILYSFKGGSNGASPSGSLLLSKGFLYGATRGGGHAKTLCGQSGCGVLFKLKK